MTFSIVARSTDGTQWGVAVASNFLAIGATVPAAGHRVGAVATQSHANLAYRDEGLRLLAEGHSAQEVVDAMTAADELRDERQLGVVDRDGGAAVFTGSDCMAWAGGRTGPGYAALGNIVSGPEVIDALAEAFEGNAGPLAHRLYQSMLAADRAGGDRRGRQSAALYVVSDKGGYGGGSDVLVDLRVDDHPDPVPELGRLLDLHDLHFGKPDPDMLLPLTGDILDEVQDRVARLGYETLDAWAGFENYEERIVEDCIDPIVLDKLREASQ
jgi:uncharacterized Ntn-hydrolase superfamily protein